MKYFKMHENSILLEIGSQNHFFSKMILQDLIKTNSHLLCIEPSILNLRDIIDFISSSGRKNISVLSCAISSNNKFSKFIHTDDSYMNYLADIKNEFDHTILWDSVVPCFNLNTILKVCNKIDFIKCNAEGAELSIFINDEIDYSKIRSIAISVVHTVGGETTDKKLKEFFDKIGFTVIVEDHPHKMLYAFNE